MRIALQGKYLGGGPREARLNKYRGRYAEAESRYGNKSNTVQAVQAYVDLAHEAGMSSATLAIRCGCDLPTLLCIMRYPVTRTLTQILLAHYNVKA